MWGATEMLNIGWELPSTANHNGITAQSIRVYPEPGKPDHFACFNPDYTPCPDVFPFWANYLTYPDTVHPGATLASGPYTIYDSYYLHDLHGNVTFGFTGGIATPPAANVSTGFSDQTNGQAGDPAGYSVATSWYNFPGMPSGSMTSTLSLSPGSR